MHFLAWSKNWRVNYSDADFTQNISDTKFLQAKMSYNIVYFHWEHYWYTFVFTFIMEDKLYMKIRVNWNIFLALHNKYL